MQQKKSQIGIFIIFGIVIFITAGFLIYLSSNSKKSEQGIAKINELSPSILPVQNYVNSCILNIGKDSILSVSMHGGYYNVPNPKHKIAFVDIPYYFYENARFNQDKKVIEQQIAEFINDNIGICLSNFTELREKGYDIRASKASVKASIASNRVILTVNLPLSINKDNSIYNIENFKVNLENVGLDKIIQLNNQIEQKQTKNPDAICLSCLSNFSSEYDIKILMNRVDETSILFTIVDNETMINNEPLLFNFAHKYREISCSNLPLDDTSFVYRCAQEKIKNISTSIKIQKIPDMDAKVSVRFLYNVLAEGKGIVFEDFTSLFDINPKSGSIDFTPINSSIGAHKVLVIARDAIGDQAYESFILNITG